MINKLSFILLNQIISLIDENIDRVCFSLICRRLYYERKHYLFFNPDKLFFSVVHTSHYNRYQTSPTIIGAYREQILSTLDRTDSIRQTIVYEKDEIDRTDKSIPYNIKSDVLKISHNLMLNDESLFLNLRVLEFGDGYDQPLPQLPNTLEKLILGRCFQQRLISKSLPDSIISLTFGWNYNHPIDRDVLPNNLEYLEFGYEFNQPIEDGLLPNTLHTLVFNGIYNRDMRTELSIPHGVRKLVLSKEYNQPLVSLPDSLESLQLGEKFTLDIESSWFPQSLKHVKSFQNKLYGQFPDNIRSLEISNLYAAFDSSFRLPNQLKRLDCRSYFIAWNDIRAVLPSLEYLSIRKITDYDSPITSHTLKCLAIELNYYVGDQLNSNFFPNLEILSFKQKDVHVYGKIPWNQLSTNLKKVYLTKGYQLFNDNSIDDVPPNIELVLTSINTSTTIRKLDSENYLALSENLQGGFINSHLIKNIY